MRAIGLAFVAAIVVLGACGTDEGGTNGIGGAPPPPANVDQTCRDWCANEAAGFSCHGGPPESVEDCYRDCLSGYQQETERECEDQWIAIKDCQLDFDCEDLFGDCDSFEEQLDECRRLAVNRDYCETNCPDLDIAECEEDTTGCRQLVAEREEAMEFCLNFCPAQNLSECIQEYLATGSCDPGTGGTGGTNGSGGEGGLGGEVLASLGQDVVVPRQEVFLTLAASLETAVADAAIDPNAREAARETWRQTITSWQEIEMMQLGPAGSSLRVMGGQGLRARIYSWPILNLCLVDQQTVEEGYDDPDALEAVVGGPLGLWAIEYLLFNESTENNCSALNTINQDGTWDAMADMIPQRRLDYAAALSALVRRGADDLVAAWAPSGGSFIAELTDPGRGGAVYGTAQEGLNAISDAMFYLDKETKDMKLGETLGITNCATATCPEAIESQWARWSKQHVIANLKGFQVLFLGASPGTDALGFDDLLIDMGAPDVAADMAQAIADAITATEAIPGTFFEALEQNPTEMEAAHAAIRNVTDILKSDFLSVLDLEAPDR